MRKIFVNLIAVLLALNVQGASITMCNIGVFQKETYQYYLGAKVGDEVGNAGTFNKAHLFYLDEFILGCKKDNVFTNIHHACFFIGSNFNAGAQMMSVQNPGTSSSQSSFRIANNQPSGGAKFDDTDWSSSGLKGNGTSYLSLTNIQMLVPSNSVHLCLYVTDGGDAGNEVDWGAWNAGGEVFAMYIPDTSTGDIVWDAYDQNPGGGRLQATPNALLGMMMGDRIVADNESTIYARDAGFGFQQLGQHQGISGVGPGANGFYLFAVNNQGTDQFHSSKRISFYSYGSGFGGVKAALYAARIQTLQLRLGRAQ